MLVPPRRMSDSARQEPSPPTLDTGLNAARLGLVTNAFLAVAKIVTGIVGNSYALIADGIESTTDILSSGIVYAGLRISAHPPDDDHPYGHGKAESISGVVVAGALMMAAVAIAVQSTREILVPHHAPAWYTLVVLAVVILLKEALYRFVFRVGSSLASTALQGDAWHHRSDALTSAAAFVGIAIALLGGKGFETADDWAALCTCPIIAYNAYRVLRPALNEIMDASAPPETLRAVRECAGAEAGVVRIEKCRVRKSGLQLIVDIHVEVASHITVREGHEIGHGVSRRLRAYGLGVGEVMVHIEPDSGDSHTLSPPGGADI